MKSKRLNSLDGRLGPYQRNQLHPSIPETAGKQDSFSDFLPAAKPTGLVETNLLLTSPFKILEVPNNEENLAYASEIEVQTYNEEMISSLFN